MAERSSIGKFFMEIDTQNRAQRMLVAHVAILSVLVYIQLIVTQIYHDDKHDMIHLASNISTTHAGKADWTEEGPKAVLARAFPDKTNPVAADAAPELSAFIHSTCFPIWETVHHEQTMFRLFLVILTCILGPYTLLWAWTRRYSLNLTDNAERMLECAIWTVTQVVEVIFIVYAFTAAYHYFTNTKTPELYNTARANLVSEGIAGAAPASGYDIKINCFELDKVLGHDLYGKHSPWIWDKLMVDIWFGYITFALVFFRYILNSLAIYDLAGAPKFGLAGRTAISAEAGYGMNMYNAVTMR